MAEDTRHTRGPWRLGYEDGSGSGPDFYTITARNRPVVLGGDGFGLPHGVRQAADARLIAAAPELLDCLREARQHLEQDRIDVVYIDEVIARAEGR
ncbi:MAG TPA: hypothetical protein VGM83_16100 [Devosiaceae bacterium]|jgi:hypothetical protein